MVSSEVLLSLRAAWRRSWVVARRPRGGKKQRGGEGGGGGGGRGLQQEVRRPGKEGRRVWGSVLNTSDEICGCQRCGSWGSLKGVTGCIGLTRGLRSPRGESVGVG